MTKILKQVGRLTRPGDRCGPPG